MQQVQIWEPQLLSLAYEASPPTKTQLPLLRGDHNLLQQAYEHCNALTAYHSRSFHLASSLLPREKRRAIRSLYAFCRVADDIVDHNPQTAVQNLQTWRCNALTTDPPAGDHVAVAWAETRARYKLPIRYAEQLVEGVARDLTQTRYESFADLATYAYAVASTVGLMSMHIIGFSGQEAIPYAVKLGLALQMTNILRDIAEDWRRGRVYLPQDELSDFGLNDEAIGAGQVTDKWREFMRFQIERNRLLYAEAWPGIGMLDEDGRFAIAAAAGLYEAILGDIERHDYDVFSRRSYIGTWGKLGRLPRIWLKSQVDF